jgi:hypothetical protein
MFVQNYNIVYRRKNLFIELLNIQVRAKVADMDQFLW